MSDNWVVQNLQNALETWNEKLAEIWTLVTQSPQSFKGGSIWNVMVSIHGAVQAIGLALIVLFFFMGVMKTCGSFADLKRPEVAVKVFVRFALAKAAVTHGLELMNALFSIAQGLVSTIMSAAGFGSVQTAVLPTEIITAVEDCGFFESIPLWAVTLIGGLLITVLSFVMIMTVYGRFFKYVTVSVCKKNIEDARAYFARVGAELTARFAALGAKVAEMDATEKLRVLHDFYRSGEEVYFRFDAQDMMRKGHDFRDYICPDSIEKHSDYLMLGGKYARVIYLKDYASFISDQLVTKLTDQSRSMMLSIDIIPVATDEAVREVERKMLGVETNITNWQRRQNANNNFSAIVPYDMEQQRRETKEYMSLLKQIDPDGIRAHHKSIIDRCVALVLQDQKKTGKVPTLCTLREKLLEQPEQEARDLALTMELYTSGSLNIFAHETNVDTRNRIQSYDIHDLGEELKQPGFVTITDAMINRVNYNWAHGKKTHIFVDEFHIAYENEYSGNFFTSAWRQFRKRNAAPCAITQNVEYMLDSVQASTMVSNSEFVVMLNQAESDQERLSKLLNISPEQMSYVNGSEAGCGLMRYGSALVPFVNRFPANTELYKLITTKPGEGLFAKGRVDCNA